MIINRWTKAEAKLDKLEKRLRLRDYRHTVTVNHQDGSSFFLTHAVVRKYGNILAVLSEHHGRFVFYVHDLKSWKIK